MTKALMFDFGKVLVSFDRSRTNHKLALHSPLSIEEIHHLLWESELYFSFERDELTQSEFYQEISKHLRFRSTMNQKMFESIYCDMFLYNAAVEKVLERVQPHIKTVLLSNTNRIHWSLLIQTLPVITRFFHDDRKLALSFLAKARKTPKVKFLKFGLSLLDTDASETVFIDDMPEYCEKFRELGGNSVQFDCAQEQFSALIHNLNRMEFLFLLSYYDMRRNPPDIFWGILFTSFLGL